ncbi:MAG TPA: hypothetical protein PK275_09120 [Chitinophagaceae bacterium]|jgi:hypothetical protein|nr:hypothetical protein [Chitinophagaceae bacterium]
MKRGLLSLLAFFSMLFASQAKSDVPYKLQTADPSAVYDSIWIDYDVKENDVLGMRIHLAFTTYNMKGMDAYVAIYYTYNDEIAGVLKDKNNKLVSTAGDVAVYKSIKPNYDPAVYKDLQIFMPYSEFDLEPGLYDLTLDAKVIYKAGGMISRLTYFDFEYTKPGSPADAVSEMKTDVLFREIKVDYDYTEKGQLGLRVHLNFSTINMKGVDAYAAVYFKLRNGDKVEGKTSTYRSKSGQLAVYKSIKPNYDESDYKDLSLFLPYDEIPGSGKIRMKMVAEIIFPSGDLIKTLGEKYFLFER